MSKNKKLDLLLVKPGGRLNLFGELASKLSGFAPPLDIGLIAGFVRQKGYSVKIIDADAEFLAPEEVVEKIIEYNPVLVGIFAHTIRMMYVSKTLKIILSIAVIIYTSYLIFASLEIARKLYSRMGELQDMLK